MSVYSVAEIAAKINDRARELAPDLLPNGSFNHNRTLWQFSGIADTGRSTSAIVHLSGPKTGKWFDYGNAAPGEDKGDMLDLLRLKLGLADAAAAVEEAKARLGIVDDYRPSERRTASPEELARRAAEAQERAERREREAAEERETKAKRAKALFLGAKAENGTIAGSPAEFYLRGRGIDREPWPGSLAYHSEVWCKPERCKVPAMLACILQADGRQIGTHRTFLSNDAARGWTKIDSPNAKMVLGNMRGGFIPIAQGASGKSMGKAPAAEPVYVTEGIEDALIVSMMKPEARVIAAISVVNFGLIVLPPAADGGQRQMIIVADRDDDAKAVDQLERSIAQQQARGNVVKLVMPPAECAGMRIKDVNDWWKALNAQKRGAA